MRILLIAAIFITAACAVRQPVSRNWRLVSRNNGRVLIPPGVGETKAGFILDAAKGRGKCPPEIRAKRGRLLVTVNESSMAKHPDGWLTDWAQDLESRGCIARGDAQKFAESLPLDPDIGFRLRFADDIEAPAQLEVVSPILRANAGAGPEAPLEVTGQGNTLTVTTSAPADQIGYETALYSVEPKPSGSGFTIVPAWAERHLDGHVERLAQPAKNFLEFPSDAAFYRLFVKSNETDFTALVIASRDWSGLQRPVSSCEPNDRMCIAIPRRVAINQMIPVTANGKEVMVLWHGRVANAIHEATGTWITAQAISGGAFRNLKVSRPYRGHLAPVEFLGNASDLLNLILIGGEVITW